jgi:hypothetical protein
VEEKLNKRKQREQRGTIFRRYLNIHRSNSDVLMDVISALENPRRHSKDDEGYSAHAKSPFPVPNESLLLKLISQ